MARYIDFEELAKRITNNIKAETPEEKDLVEWCKDECIRQGYAMPTADVVPKSEYADMEIRALRAEIQLTKQQNLAESRKTDVERYLSEIEKLQEVILKKEDLMQTIAKEKQEYFDDIVRLKDDNEYLQDKVFKVRLEVAREIFEEIEKYSEVALMNGHIDTPILCIGMGVLAELKKKYTEGDSETGSN